VQLAMRYSPPTIEAVQAELLRPPADWEQVIVLPLFPQFSVATTGSCHQEWQRNMAPGMGTILIGGFHNHPAYIAAVTGTVKQALRKKPGGEACHILFSAHGLPESYIRKGDPYQAHIEETVRAVMEELPNDHSLAYQSKVGPVKWIGPAMEDAIAALGAAGQRRLVVVPIAFVSEHVETLHELDILMAGYAADAGITDYRRAPTVGTDRQFIAALADICRNPERYAA
ncbi:MAG: ferrochelatase, partial [Candidatus Marinimicrobia bacterium]|nr:ferrochelatase [Candidatus Neomarinimicrobiota bacterium]